MPLRGSAAAVAKSPLTPVGVGAILLLFWMSGPVAPFIPELDSTLATMLSMGAKRLSAPADVNGDLLRMSWIPGYALIVGLAVSNWRLVWNAFLRNWLVLSIVSWCLLSTMWSVSPDDTLRRSIALTLSSTFGIYLGARFGVLPMIRLLGAALTIGMVASVVCCIAFPTIGIAGGPSGGAWRGVYTNKNSLGAMMLCAILTFYVLYLADGRSRWQLLRIFGALLLLALSTSKTPVVILCALVPTLQLTGHIFRNPRRFGASLGLAVCALALFALLGSILLEPMLVLLGKDITLTGRTFIWALSWDAIQARYWAGYGYGAFWSNPYGPVTEIWDSLNWRVPSSHSGILELWLALGLVGVTLFLGLIARTFLAIGKQSTDGAVKREECLWVVGYMLVFTIYMLSEPSSLDQTSISWVLFAALVSAVSRWPLRRPAHPAQWSRSGSPAFGDPGPASRRTSPIVQGSHP